MTILEFLSSQLDREASQYDNQPSFCEYIDFWNLCLEARRILLEEKIAKDENVTHNE